MVAAPEAQSPVDIFAKFWDPNSQPGDAIHTALKGIDGNKLTTFKDKLQDSIQSAIESGGRAASTIVADALKATNADANFAKKIKAVFKAAEPSFKQKASSLVMSSIERERFEKAFHHFASGIDKGVDDYVGSLETRGQPTEPNGQRRHFNKAQLTEAQHISAGTATTAEVKDVQKELKAEGLDIGRFGRTHDGVDGIAGKFTGAAISRAIKPPAGP